MNEDLHHIPPALLVKSFLLVAGGYVVSLVTLFGLALCLAILFFPETKEALGQDPEIFEKQWQENPQAILPVNMFWPLWLAYIACCFAIGYLVARLASFAKFSHCLFLAAIIFAGFLQQAIGTPGEMQWMIMLFMAAAPIAILLGAQACLKPRAESETAD